MRKAQKVVGIFLEIWGGVRAVVDLLSSFEATRNYAHSAYLEIATAPASRTLTVSVIVVGLALLLFEPIKHFVWPPPISLRPENESDEILPAARPKITPLRWGKGPDRNTGLIIENHGEAAFDIAINEPIQIGAANLDFRKRVCPSLRQTDGERLMEAAIRLSTGTLTGGGALRSVMVEAELPVISLEIQYRDFDGRKYITTCDLLTDKWGNGLRISNVRQRKA